MFCFYPSLLDSQWSIASVIRGELITACNYYTSLYMVFPQPCSSLILFITHSSFSRSFHPLCIVVSIQISQFLSPRHPRCQTNRSSIQKCKPNVAGPLVCEVFMYKTPLTRTAVLNLPRHFLCVAPCCFLGVCMCVCVCVRVRVCVCLKGSTLLSSAAVWPRQQHNTS